MVKLYRNLCLVVGVLLLVTWAVIPPERKLRLGKDLRGGVSLVYSVQVNPGEDAEQIINRTIEVLKERVDPDGVMDISMIAQGRERIEITMPLPGEDVKRLKQEFEERLNALAGTAVSPSRLSQWLATPAEQRGAQLASLSAGDPAREARLRGAAEAVDRAAQLRAEVRAAREAGLTGEALDDLINRAGEAAEQADAAQRAVLAMSVSVAEVRQALLKSSRERSILDARTNTAISIPSPRRQETERLLAAHPDNADALRTVFAAFEAYEARRTTLDDPEDLKRMLRGAGVLSFRIAVEPGYAEEQRLRQELRERGPRNVRSGEARWFKVNQIENWYDSVQEFELLRTDPAAFFAGMGTGYIGEEFRGEYYLLLWDTRTQRLTQEDSEWSVTRAAEDRDQFGRPNIVFTMNPTGAASLSQLTREPSQRRAKMAVLLDDEVYTAPTLQGELGKNVEITGDFSAPERRYLIQVLSAGSLQARLTGPISENTIGPELGADNLRMGMQAGVVALIVVSGFMIVYYFGCGMIAVVALFVNSLIILGCMSLARSAFTMPGIAGIILTFGMAVDSNVLVFERMREELRRGADLRTATRLGFSKALSSIVDGNVTSLIVCVVLAHPRIGTPEIRGFAITMGIGVIGTLFTAVTVSRLIFELLITFAGWRRTSMLPMAVPGLQRALTPSVNWLRLRYIFWGISAVYVALGLVMAGTRGAEMFDIEFRGGTQVTVQFRTDPATGEHLTMTRGEVEERVRALAQGQAQGTALAEFANAEVSPINPAADGVTSDTFSIKTLATDQREVSDAVLGAFQDKIDEKPALGFRGSDATRLADAPVAPVLGSRLGDAVGRPELGDDVRAYIGGLAVVLEDITPRVTEASLRERLEQTRARPEHAATLNRVRDVRVLEWDGDRVKTAVVLVNDEGLTSFMTGRNWETDVALDEWTIVREALTSRTTLASVQAISPAIAATFAAQAILATVVSFLAIGVYIWIRFSGVRYSVAAIVALCHDVLCVIGLVALCEILFEHEATRGIATSLGLLPFKIDLNMVAAILTIAGYSLNDTVVIMDRIRENRGKYLHASADMINTAINQTLSRTVITAGTTLISSSILYIFGGEGVRAFAFVLLIGCTFGCYSTIAIAAPMVWSRKEDEAADSAAALKPAT